MADDRPGTDGKRPPLVFLHGWTMDGAVFSDLTGRLAGWTCLAPTLPGHGRMDETTIGGDMLPGAADLDNAARQVRALLNTNGITRPVLIGWSLGAMVAWRMLEHDPSFAPAGLVVIDMSPKIVNGADWSLGIRGFEERHNQRALAAMADDWPAYAKRINAGMYARGDERAHAETLSAILSRDPAAMGSMWASLSRADARVTVQSRAIPTLVIKGAKSRIYPAETGRWIAENAPAATLVRFEHSGHSPHLEEPDRFAAVLSDWVAGLAR